ncbi:hypothetical protein M3J09_012545 [Ascochyta lentis]
MPRQLRSIDYTVGWVCALPVELAAAQLMLDEEHDDLERDPADNHDNLYVLGSIGGHNVAIGCLPAGQTGTNSAAVVATQMLATFKKIRIGLMVGIGGGVPSTQADVRLGDVVVSQPDATFGGVVQYDLGKSTVNGFLRTGLLNSPPRTLLNAVSRVQANELLERSGLSKHALRLERLSKFQRDNTGPDVLFAAEYDHENPHARTCDRCRTDKRISRQPRNTNGGVSVHYGTIASGNRVMKNAAERDKASAQLGGVLCFEMEAAGLMNAFPCLVVRGICDYADSHKNDRWQPYAAAIPAAYAKELLLVIKPTEVANSWTADNVMRGSSDAQELDIPQSTSHATNLHILPTSSRGTSHEGSHQPSSNALHPKTKLEISTLSDEQRNRIKDSLHFKQRDARLLTLKQAQAKTCRWLLKNAQYSDWMHVDKLKQHRGFFWIKGKPGSGKSIMMKFLFSQAKRTMKKCLVLSFFFNARGDDLEKSTTGLYRALLLQLLDHAPQAWKIFDSYEKSAFEFMEDSGWQNETLRELFTRCLQELGDQRVVCYVDALDECPEEDIRDMVSFFEELGEIEEAAEFRVCFSSRHYPEISIRTGLQLVLETEPEHTNDITLYIYTHLKIGTTAQVEDIRAEILRKSSGIFLWVHLVIPMLNKEYDTGRIKALKKRLALVPAGLHDLFVDMLTRDQKNPEYLTVCVQVILYAARPLKAEEFRIAVESFCEGEYALDHSHSDQMTAENLRKFVLDASKGLAEITKSKEPTVQWIHESVRDFFLKEDGMKKLQRNVVNPQGLGHSTFLKICLQQLDAVYVYLARTLPHGGLTSWSHFLLPEQGRLKLSGAPLMRYVMDFTFWHADCAQKSGLDQTSFLESFRRLYQSTWVRIHDILDKTGDTDACLLYLLAKYGCAELIRIHPERRNHLLLEGGQYGLPLVAALYAGHAAAARALVGLSLEPEEKSTTAVRPQLHRNLALKRESFRESRKVLTYLCEFGDADILRSVFKAETSFISTACFIVTQALGGPVSFWHCFSYASSEAVVEVLVELGALGSRASDWYAANTVPLARYAANTVPLASIDEKPVGMPLEHLKSVLKKHPALNNDSDCWGGHESLLVYAAAKGFDGIAKLCIEETTFFNKQKALLAAVRGRINQSGRILILEQLFKAGLQSEKDNQDLEQALFEIICQPHNEEVVSLLLARANLNLEAKNKEGMTPLLWALYQGRKTYVRLFLNAGSDAIARDSKCGATSLILAVKLGDLSSFRLLLAQPGCRPNVRDDLGRTALMWCAMVADACAITMISDLLKRKDVHPNLKDRSGRTALMRAVESGNVGLVQVLLRSDGTRPDFGSCHRSTPLRRSFLLYVKDGHEDFLEIARRLLWTGHADPHCPRKLPTPTEIAYAHKSTELIRLLEVYNEGAFA